MTDQAMLQEQARTLARLIAEQRAEESAGSYQAPEPHTLSYGSPSDLGFEPWADGDAPAWELPNGTAVRATVPWEPSLVRTESCDHIRGIGPCFERLPWRPSAQKRRIRVHPHGRPSADRPMTFRAQTRDELVALITREQERARKARGGKTRLVARRRVARLLRLLRTWDGPVESIKLPDPPPPLPPRPQCERHPLGRDGHPCSASPGRVWHAA